MTEKLFVRAYKPMRELLGAAIIEAEGTPYHDGLFFFDVCMPGGYVTSFSPEPVCHLILFFLCHCTST